MLSILWITTPQHAPFNILQQTRQPKFFENNSGLTENVADIRISRISA